MQGLSSVVDQLTGAMAVARGMYTQYIYQGSGIHNHYKHIVTLCLLWQIDLLCIRLFTDHTKKFKRLHSPSLAAKLSIHLRLVKCDSFCRLDRCQSDCFRSGENIKLVGSTVSNWGVVKKYM